MRQPGVVVRLTAAEPSAGSIGAQVRDLWALTKPRITSMVLMTTAGGLLLAPGQVSLPLALLVVGCTGLVVASANSLNCFLERDSDARMHRTKDRPLAAGRLSPSVAVAMGALLAGVSLPALAIWAHPIPAAAAAFALVSYVWVYTPMKRRSPIAILVGSVPGAMPPLIGWTAATGRIDAQALTLFAILFVWQVPHFLAIALYLQDDYARGGLRVMPLVDGEKKTHRWMVAWSVAQLLVSLLPVPLGMAGLGYGVIAAGLGLWYLGLVVKGVRDGASRRWGRQVMRASLVYLVILVAALVLFAA